MTEWVMIAPWGPMNLAPAQLGAEDIRIRPLVRVRPRGVPRENS